MLDQNNNYLISLSTLIICLLDDVLYGYYTGRSYMLIMKKEAEAYLFSMWLGWSIIPQDISCIWWGWNRRLASQPSSCAWWHMRSSAWLHNFNWYNSQGDVIWRGNNMRQQHGWPITTSRQDSLSLLSLILLI